MEFLDDMVALFPLSAVGPKPLQSPTPSICKLSHQTYSGPVSQRI